VVEVIELPPPTYEQTIEAIVNCDIPRANVKIAYKEILQSDEITITDLGEVNERKLQCLRAAVQPFYILIISSRAQQSAYYDFSRREDRPAERKEAREWLRARQLLDHVPSLDGSQTVEEFTRAIEVACALKPGSALKSFGASSLTLQPSFWEGRSFEAFSEKLACIMNMFAASDAYEKGVAFVFIGHEAVNNSDSK
jgi:hypothetical protein